MTIPPKKSDRRTSAGRVVLVGAGPGDPGLITVRGLEALRQAEIVIYDALVNPKLLAEVSDNAELIDAGKRSREHKLTQDQTNALLVEKAKTGRLVVRLKGGDPYLFGRGAEEVAYMAAHGVACEVVPGITAGIAAPMYAGIPVTHRAHASTLTFVTAHEDPTKDASAVDYAALARLITAGGTVCFYMGVGRLSLLSQTLQQGGCASDTPAAVVQWGTRPTQRSVRATLTTLPGEVERQGIGAPAIIIVGPVAAIDEPGLNFFESRPLFGQTVLVTRTRQQASDLSRLLEAQGANVIEAPTIEVTPVEHDQIDLAMAAIPGCGALILTSANAVKVVADWLDRFGLDHRMLGPSQIVTVGQATTAALWDHFRLKPFLVPKQTSGEGIALELLALPEDELIAKTAMLIRADIARPDLPRLLREAGWEVDEIIAYRTRRADALPDEALAALRDRKINWVTFTSASTARNLVTLLGEERGLLEGVRCASIGPVTSEAMRELGLPVDVEAASPSVEAMVQAMIGGGDE